MASFETLSMLKEGSVLFADIAAPPMNLLGPALVRDLVSLIQDAESDQTVKVLVFQSADSSSRAATRERFVDRGRLQGGTECQ